MEPLQLLEWSLVFEGAMSISTLFTQLGVGLRGNENNPYDFFCPMNVNKAGEATNNISQSKHEKS